MSLVIKLPPKKKMTLAVARILESDKNNLEKLGGGMVAKGLRILIESTREDLIKFLEQNNSNKKLKKLKLN